MPKLPKISNNWRGGDWFFLIIIAAIAVAGIIALIYGYSIGLSAALLISATALSISLFTPFLEATFLERRRRRSELLVKREALREAFYNEMGDIIHTFHQIFDDPFLTRIKVMGLNTEMHTTEGDLILLNQLKMNVDRLIRFDVYDHTRSDPTLFYGFGNEARQIDWFYRMIKSGIKELDSQIKEAERDLRLQEALLAEKQKNAPLVELQRNIAAISGTLWGVTPKDPRERALDRTEFLETFEKTYLKKATSYLDEDSLDYLKQFIDPEDQDYFEDLRKKDTASSKPDAPHKETAEDVEVTLPKAESDTATPTEYENEIEENV